MRGELPENEALGSLLLEKLVKCSLCTGENVRWQRGAWLPHAAQVELGDLKQSAARRQKFVKRLQDTLPYDSTDLFPKHKSKFISNFESHL